jgi:CDP-glucose 4,6-dehydratase
MTALRPGAFHGVRALVTGHTGFKGAWLSEWLLSDGAEVAGLALPPEEGQPSLFHDLGLQSRTASRFGDIRDLATVEAAMSEFAPKIIFHLAAQALVRRAYADPVGTFATNVMGSAHVLDAARRCPSVEAIVCVTSDKCYDNQEWVWGYRESDPLGGKDPYSASKAAAEIVAGSYRQAILPAGVAMATARGGNVVGGGDWSEDRLVPDLVRAIGEGRQMVLRNPGALRPWQHVLELLRGYLTLGNGLLAGEPVEGSWNFGPGPENEITVADLAGRFMLAWGGHATFAPRIEPSPLIEAQILRLDISKAHALLGWRPVLGVDETVRMTADWYRLHAQFPGRAADLTRDQIASYRKLAVLKRVES